MIAAPPRERQMTIPGLDTVMPEVQAIDLVGDGRSPLAARSVAESQLPLPSLSTSGPLPGELVIDFFAGGGGASSGLMQAMNRVDWCVNHDWVAITTLARNHHGTRLQRADVFAADPEAMTGGHPVGVFWASPKCTNHSRAKGDIPSSEQARTDAWIIPQWAEQVRPRIILAENVPEWTLWGPVDAAGHEIPEQRGQTFQAMVDRIGRAGYAVEHRILNAADYGAGTSRERVFLVARNDGRPIRWPEATHGPGLQPYVTALDCLELDRHAASILDRAEPLAEKSAGRVARGVQRFLLEHEQPLVVERRHIPHDPARVAQVESFLAPFLGTVASTCVDRPRNSTTGFIVHYYSNGGQHQALDRPLHTIPTKDRHALALVDVDAAGRVADIRYRMLAVSELRRAQGFPEDYYLPPTKSDALRLIGNSVCPQVAAALCTANVAGLAV